MSHPASVHPPSPPLGPVTGWSVLLAVLAPLLVLGLPLSRWVRPDPPAQKGEVAVRLERAVAADPDVVVVGASKVGTDLDLPLLARMLGLPREEIAGVNLSGTTAPVWYAVLDNRVFGTGKAPKLVIVYSTFDWTLATAPTGETERAVLAGQLDGDDPVLEAKVMGASGNPLLARVRRHRTDDHSAMMGWIRDTSVGALLAEVGEGQGARQAGAALAAPALERLFGAGAAVDTVSTARAIPIVEADRARAGITAARVEDTLLPDFVDLAEAHGAKVVFVVAPVRRSAEVDFETPPATARAAVQLLNTRGAGYTDLRDLHLPDTAFGDQTHLAKVGREALTRALGERLVAMGALGEGPLQPARLPVVQAEPAVTRSGTPPAPPTLGALRRGGGACDWEAAAPGLAFLSDSELERLGLGMVSPLRLLEDDRPLRANATRDDFAFRCGGAAQHQGNVMKFAPTDGPAEVAAARSYRLAFAEEVPVRNARGVEGWWVYPGTSLRLDFPEGWKSEEADPGFFVALDALELGPAAGRAAVTMRVGEGDVVPLTGPGAHRAAVWSLPPPTGPWSLVVEAPAEGGWVLLRRLRVGNAADTRVILGDDGGTSVPAFVGTAAWTGAAGGADPPSLSAEPLRFEPGPAGSEGVGMAEIGGLGVPDTDALWKVSSVAGCSPVRVEEDGVPLPSPVVRLKDVVAKGKGAFAQVGRRLYVLGSDGSSPATNGRRYVPRLDPTRVCRGLRWLYPGDRLRLTLPATQLYRLLGDVTKIEIGGAAVVPEGSSAEVGLRVWVGEAPRLDTRFPLSALATSTPAWAFEPPLPRGPEPIVVELALPEGAPYLLLSSVALTEPGHALGAGGGAR